MKGLILACLLLCGPVAASPVLFTGSVDIGASVWNDDFSRAQGLVPLGAEILSADLECGTVRLHFAFDPDAEFVWRRVILTRNVHPVPVPLDRFIGEVDGVYLWDEGQFAQPLGKVAADRVIGSAAQPRSDCDG